MIELQKKVFFCYCIKNDTPLFIDAPSLENICKPFKFPEFLEYRLFITICDNRA